MAILEGLHVHPRMFVAKVLNYLHRTMRAIIVLDETADESDDNGRRRRRVRGGYDRAR
jgi:2-phosphoglycerate kinase